MKKRTSNPTSCSRPAPPTGAATSRLTWTCFPNRRPFAVRSLWKSCCKVPNHGKLFKALKAAWLYAGARTLLASLWAVNDPATAHLMTGFYRRWRAGGQDKATALRAAMDETRRAHPEWAHTRYWGAFTLVGDWR